MTAVLKARQTFIEPMEKEVLVRYRVDGVLRPVMTLPKQVQPVLSRASKFWPTKIDEHMQPQDGRIKLVVKTKIFSARFRSNPSTMVKKWLSVY